MGEATLYPRFAEPRLVEALGGSPVVLIHGPRQCGKTTLARRVGERAGYAYFSFDEPAALAAAREDPAGFVADLPERAILDEVQHVPSCSRRSNWPSIAAVRRAAFSSPGSPMCCWSRGYLIRWPGEWRF